MRRLRKSDGKEPQLVENVVCIRESAAALLIRVPAASGDKIEIWIPKSQIDYDESEVLAQGDVGSLVIPKWLADEKGL